MSHTADWAPEFFDPHDAARWSHRPDVARLHTEADVWRARFGIAPSSDDTRRAHLLLIDVQRDFCLPEGTLYVGGRSGRGAVDDSASIATLIYAQLGRITDITCTFDAHSVHQLFFPAFWVDADGRPATPHQTVSGEDLRQGRLRPAPAMARLVGQSESWLGKQVLDYVEKLERAGQYALYLWPYHCLVGSEGQSLVGVVDEARTFHALVRRARPWNVLKGDALLTESYSALRPEVMTAHDGTLLAPAETALLERLRAADVVLVAGQAASHCVRSTVDDLLDRIEAVDPAGTRRVHVLTDCTSSVTVPDGKGGFMADFTPRAEEAFARWASRGARLVTSAEPFG